MLIYVVGPSKAGKTEATKALIADPKAFGICQPTVRIDLDEVLGPGNRGMGQKAVDYCRSISLNENTVVLVDVGAGQLVSTEFRAYLRRLPAYPDAVVVVNCGEEAFRRRHGANAVNEVGRYYGKGSLEPLWIEAAESARIVDSSGQYAPTEWARTLGMAVRRAATKCSGPTPLT